MALSTRRACRGIFVTSFTTAFAFVATSLSEVIPIRTFGTFSATLVVVDFALTLTLFPAFLLMHHRLTKQTWYKRAAGKLSQLCRCRCRSHRKAKMD